MTGSAPTPCTGSRRARGTPWPIPAGLDTVEANGYPLAYQDRGAGAPVVLLHGSLNDYRSWALQVPELSERYRVLAPSLRHYYPEPWDGRGADFSISQHADDVVAFIEVLGLPAVHLLGHSRGGAVALTVARRAPQRVASLMLADPRGLESLLPDTPQTHAMEFELRNSFATLRHNLATGDVDRAAREFVDGLGGAGAWDRRPREVRQVLLDNLATAVDTGEFPTIGCADVAGLDFPMLLISGEKSPRRYAAMFAAMKACSPAVPDPVTIPGAAHSMQRENPTRFNAEVMRFLAGVGRTGHNLEPHGE
jgi:esterase